MEAYRRRLRKCVVPGCNDLYSKRHIFPKDNPELFNKWVQQVQNRLLENKTCEQILKSYVVCHVHFSEYFKVPGTKRGLKKNAFPTEFLPTPNQQSTSSTHQNISQADIKGSARGTSQEKLQKLTCHPLEKGIIRLKLLLSNTLASPSAETTGGFEKEVQNEEKSKQLLLKEGNNDNNCIVKLEETQVCENKNENVSAKYTAYKMGNDGVLREFCVKEEQVDDKFIEWGEGPEPNCVVKFEHIEVIPEEWRNEPLLANEIENVLSDRDPVSKMDIKNVLGEYPVKEEQVDEDSFESNCLEEIGEIKIELEANSCHSWDQIQNEVEENSEELHDLDIKGSVLDESNVKFELENVSNEEVIADEVNEPDFVSWEHFNETQEDTDHKYRKTTDRKYKCNVCSHQTDIYSNFWRHKKIHKPRSDQKLFECDVCRRMYASKIYLERHKLLHTRPGERPKYNCHLCSFQTSYIHAMRMHEKTHTNKTMPYKCSQCPYQTNVCSELQKHNVTHKARSDRDLVECATCGNTYVSKFDLTRHMVLHMDPKDRPTFNCDKCDYKTVYKSALKLHGMKHVSKKTLRYKCKKCEYRTDNPGLFKSHKLSHKDPFECKSCGGTYISKHDLKRHMVLHIMDPTYSSTLECDVCNFKTVYKSAMNLHKATHENAANRFECNKCPYQTEISGNLKKHKLTHMAPSDRDLFKCATCGCACTTKSNLKQHMLLHMDPKDVPTFDCDMCDFKTIYKSGLNMHKSKVHVYWEMLDVAEVKIKSEC